MIGRPRCIARGRLIHIAMRVRQKSRTARKTTLAFAPVADPAVRG
jgi:hypothetical protein